MSEDKEIKDEQLEQEVQEQSPVEETAPATPTQPDAYVHIHADVLDKLTKVLDKNNDFNIKLNKQIEDLTKRFDSLKEKVDAKELPKFRGEVKGTFNYGEKKAAFLNELYKTEQQTARELLARARERRTLPR